MVVEPQTAVAATAAVAEQLELPIAQLPLVADYLAVAAVVVLTAPAQVVQAVLEL